MGSRKPDFGDGASPGKIFIGGLAKDATLDQFVKYFEKYGEITDSVIMKDRDTGRPRGFGFITYADPAVVDSVIAETHIINNKQVEIKRTIPKGSAESKVEIKRTIPKGSAESKVFRTKKIFVGGIPASLSEDEFKSFFSKYGAVIEHEIIRDRETKRSRGFGFIVFDNEQVVDTILSNGNSIDIDGTQVEIKKAEPKKPSFPASAPAFPSQSRGRSYNDYGGFDNSHANFRTGGFALGPYRSFGSRFGDYGGYGDGGTGEFCGRYGDFPGGAYVGRFGDYSGYVGGVASRYGSYVGGFSEGYGRSGLGAYGRGGRYGGYYGGTGPGSGYESGAGNEGAGGQYGGRTGFSGGVRYHPYARPVDPSLNH